MNTNIFFSKTKGNKLHLLLMTVCIVVLGVVYFFIMDSSIPKMKRENCSYTSGVVTDILAFLVGILLMWRGAKSNDYIVFICGGVIIVEHVIQIFAKGPVKKVEDDEEKE